MHHDVDQAISQKHERPRSRSVIRIPSHRWNKRNSIISPNTDNHRSKSADKVIKRIPFIMNDKNDTESFVSGSEANVDIYYERA